MTAEAIFRTFSASKLRQLGGRIEVCLGKLGDERVWARGGPNENTAGNLVLHLCGNMRQWIGTGIAGLEDVRERDAEFRASGGASAAELAARLRSAVNEAAGWIEAAPDEKLLASVRVQNYDLTGLEAVYHVVEHFAEHTGQIIFMTKRLTGEDLAFYGHLKHAAHAEKTP